MYADLNGKIALRACSMQCDVDEFRLNTIRAAEQPTFESDEEAGRIVMVTA